MDHTEFLSKTSKSRKYSAIRALQKYISQPGLVNLGGGLPNPKSFPFKQLSVTLADGTLLDIPPQDLQAALQYGQTKGNPRLLNWLFELQKTVHKPAVEFDICVGCGSQDLMTKALEMLLDPQEDTLLIESPTYVGILAFLRPFGVNMVQIDQDDQGVSASKLEQILSTWPPEKKKPRVLYTVSTASNPTGTTTTAQRKREILNLAEKYSLIILEDDPYYFLQFTRPLTPSYFALDTTSHGRVLRFDSFSKVLSAGARLGFVSGPLIFIDRLQMHQMSTVLNPSGISQLLLSAYVEREGVQGFLRHVGGEDVSGLYLKRRDWFVGLLEKYMTEKATWNVPDGGMFCWIDLAKSGVVDSFELVSKKCVEHGVLLVPGQEFYPDQRKCSFVRASFSYSSLEDMEVGIQRLASLL